MDCSPLPLQRKEDAPLPAKPPIWLASDKRPKQERPVRPYSGKIRTAKDSSEFIRVPRRTCPPRSEDDANATHFTVGNVGAGGTLYLKPGRMPAPNLTIPPATPPSTSDGAETIRTEWPGARRSDMSDTWTPVHQPRGTAYDRTVPVPPLSMANVRQTRRTRSQSFSTVSDGARIRTFDSTDFQLLVNGRDANGRPKSSVDLTDGFLQLHMPHYRLGTPRFSERGTAYLHNSLYTATSDEIRSSTFSRTDYDKLFPAPPGRAANGTAATFMSRHSLSQAHSLTPTRTPPTPQALTPTQSGKVHNSYDRIEANPNDPSIVRYAPVTGRIVAATPARLIAQITSPHFLDYELLSDFFLTFRAFMASYELLDHLIERLKWALASTTDAGRIVRVRTFVALRHWILNYFGDDFVSEYGLRQRFCDLVNELARELRQRLEGGGSDMNILGELKKCWRRTCAMYWPLPHASDSSPDADVVPGEEQASKPPGASAVSLPLSLHQGWPGDGRQVAIREQSPAEEAQPNGPSSAMQPVRRDTASAMRKASIPTSPMSEQSLQVISCSVPFLRNIQPATKAAFKQHTIRPTVPQRNPPLTRKPSRPTHGHKRSGSFSDALRDERAPLPSTKVDSADTNELRTMTFTGGLVRGLLLQPAPARVAVLSPISPGFDSQNSQSSSIEQNYFEGRPAQNPGVKRIVGDVRRALSSRKAQGDCLSRSQRSATSNGSRDSEPHASAPAAEAAPASAWQQLRGPPRLDMLGANIELSYKDATANVFGDPDPETEQPAGVEPQSGKEGHEERNRTLVLPNAARLNSHVTTSSRSIVIVDDTGLLGVPSISRATSSVSSRSEDVIPMEHFHGHPIAIDDLWGHDYQAGGVLPSPTEHHNSARISRVLAYDTPMRDALTVPEAWKVGQTDSAVLHGIPKGYPEARKSSSAHPSALGRSSPQHLLRRRPGGNLRAADHVHELEPLPRPSSAGSRSTFSLSLTSSAALSRERSGTHFSSQNFSSQLASLRAPGMAKDSVGLMDTHSSQPNLLPFSEGQASRLASLKGPDTGGIKEALMRLEGKFEAPVTDASAGAVDRPDSEMPALTRQESQFAVARDSGTPELNELNLGSPGTETQGASIYRLSGSDGKSTDSGLYWGEHTAMLQAAEPALQRDSKAPRFPIDTTASPSLSHKSVAFVEKAQNMERVAKGESANKSDSAPRSVTPQGSFLLDDNESLSDISTEITDQPKDDSLGVRSFFFDDTMDSEPAPVRFQAPPTPPSTVGRSTEQALGDHFGNTPASPDPLRPLKEAQSAPKLRSPTGERRDFQQSSGELRRVKTLAARNQHAHLPFVMAFESEVVAEQLTIIEKDALDEIVWKDLINLSWQQSPAHVRNWVDYLKREDSNGMDMVIARFNLVVKWVVSECVLTQALAERARCIIKYIHIATHCRRMRNYASMYQITLALLSTDLARLHQTWSLVADAEKQMLDKLDSLCQPQHNFYHLRAEMESSMLDHGCIPFIGLYTHDLMYNAQKPARIDPTLPSKEPLINFERYQTAARITKSLLRLLEASSKYIFRPHPEVLSRCLWLATLEDAEIIAHSKALEP